jgi:hypothetical protein
MLPGTSSILLQSFGLQIRRIAMAADSVKSRFSPGALKGFSSLDGKKNLFILKVAGDLFCYSEESELYEPPSSVGDYFYWAETQRSGLYATPEEAEREARRAIEWFRDEIRG